MFPLYSSWGVFISSIYPSSQEAKCIWTLGWHLNNTQWYFYIHFMCFHDTGLFLFFISSVDLRSPFCTPLSHRILLVITYSCSKNFLRSHHLPFSLLLLLSPPSVLSSPYHLNSPISHIPHSIWKFSICMVIIYVLALP